jgi:hypothetical protein
MALVLSVALFGATSSAFAQGVSGGIKGGVNFSNITFDSEEGDDPQFDSRTGLVAGAFVTFPMADTFSVQPEVLYSVKGAKFTEEGIESTVRVDYVEIPVLARYSSAPSGNSSFQVFAGPYVAFKTKAEATTEFDGEDFDEDLDEDVEDLDFGVVVGGGVEAGHFVVDLRYSWGLKNANAVESDQLTIKHKVFSIMAGIRF